MSFGETIFLFVLALVVFGPKKLPEIARQVGKYLNEFKRASNEFKAQIEHEITQIEVQEKQKKLAVPAGEPEGTASRSLKPAEAAAESAPALAESSLAGPTTASETNSSSSVNGSAAASDAPALDQAATEAVPAIESESAPAPASQESHA